MRGVFEHHGGLSGLAGQTQVVPEHDRVFRRQLPVLFELPEVRDRELVPSGGGERHRARAPGHEEPRRFVQHRRQLTDGELRLDPRRGHAAIQRTQQMHAILRVRSAPVPVGTPLPPAT